MTRRTSIVEQVSAYFAEKGAIMTADEYKNAEDAPVRFQLIKRNIGPWSRLLNMIEKNGAVEVVPAPTEGPVEVVPAPTEGPASVPASEIPAEKEKPTAVEKTKGA